MSIHQAPGWDDLPQSAIDRIAAQGMTRQSPGGVGPCFRYAQTPGGYGPCFQYAQTPGGYGPCFQYAQTPGDFGPCFRY